MSGAGNTPLIGSKLPLEAYWGWQHSFWRLPWAGNPRLQGVKLSFEAGGSERAARCPMEALGGRDWPDSGIDISISEALRGLPIAFLQAIQEIYYFSRGGAISKDQVILLLEVQYPYWALGLATPIWALEQPAPNTHCRICSEAINTLRGNSKKL